MRFLSIARVLVRQLRVLLGGKFALQYAIRSNDLHLLSKLTKRQVHKRRFFLSDDPLVLASRLGRASVVRHLVDECGVDPASNWGDALASAADIGTMEIVSMLVRAIVENRAGHSTELLNVTLSRALLAAARTGHRMICSVLLDAGAYVDFRDGGPSGYTSLMYAVMSGEHETAQELLRRGADSNANAVNDDHPIQMAVMNCDLAMVRILAAAGAALEVRTQFGPLIDLAKKCGCREVADFLASHPTPGR